MLIAAEITSVVIAEEFLLLQDILMLTSSFCSFALFHDFSNMLSNMILNYSYVNHSSFPRRHQ